jgi:lysozyme family protein
MKDNFEETIRFILKEEGGYVEDHAGATKMGVTIGLMKALGLDLDHDGDVDARDVRLVDPDVVRRVFRAQFWDPVGGDDLPAGMDLLVSDFGYNAGPKRASSLFASQDARDPAAYTLKRQLYYWSLREGNPKKFGKYFDGWIGRSLRAWQRAKEFQAKA